MATVQVAPELQVETEQFLTGLALLDISEIQRFHGQVDAILTKKNGDSLSAEEKERISHANLELPEGLHQRYIYLNNKQKEQPLNLDEEAERSRLDERIQEANATRLKHLRFLTHVRDIPFEKLVEQYGLYLSPQTCAFIEETLVENQQRNQAARELLRRMREDDDAEEQRETWAYLKVALDEDRLSDRKLFP